MRRRSHDFDWDEFPVYGGQGSLHDLSGNDPEPRLWFARSVSRSAAHALSKRDEPQRHPMGFRTSQHPRG